MRRLERRIERLQCSRAHAVWYAQTCACITVWFTASVFIAFANKHLLSDPDFHFPFFLTCCSNSGVALLAFFVTRLPPLRQKTVKCHTFVRKVVPLAAATTLDIGFSNWSMIFLDVAFHTIIKGTAPLFVLLCGLALRVERPSRRTLLAIVVIVGGLSLVACDRLTLKDRPLGLLLGLVSVGFTGTRWALTQLLMRGQYTEEAKEQPAERAGATGGSGEISGTGNGTSTRTGNGSGTSTSTATGADAATACAAPAVGYCNGSGTSASTATGADAATASAPAGTGRPPAERTHPLSTMLHTMPVIACIALVLTCLLERDIVDSLRGFYDDGRLPSLLAYLLTLCLLVFALVLAEFHLVLLTSSLTVAVFGVLKELITVLAAVLRGDSLSWINAIGVVLCLLGNMLYFKRRVAPDEEEESPPGPAAGEGCDAATGARSESGSSSAQVAVTVLPPPPASTEMEEGSEQRSPRRWASSKPKERTSARTRLASADAARRPDVRELAVTREPL